MFLGATMCSSLALLSLYLVSTTVYRLFFRPLTRFPGPMLAAATKWYEFYFDIIKRSWRPISRELSRMHDDMVNFVVHGLFYAT